MTACAHMLFLRHIQSLFRGARRHVRAFCVSQSLGNDMHSHATPPGIESLSMAYTSCPQLLWLPISWGRHAFACNSTGVESLSMAYTSCPRILRLSISWERRAFACNSAGHRKPFHGAYRHAYAFCGSLFPGDDAPARSLLPVCGAAGRHAVMARRAGGHAAGGYSACAAPLS